MGEGRRTWNRPGTTTEAQLQQRQQTKTTGGINQCIQQHPVRDPRNAPQPQPASHRPRMGEKVIAHHLKVQAAALRSIFCFFATCACSHELPHKWAAHMTAMGRLTHIDWLDRTCVELGIALNWECSNNNTTSTRSSRWHWQRHHCMSNRWQRSHCSSEQPEAATLE